MHPTEVASVLGLDQVPLVVTQPFPEQFVDTATSAVPPPPPTGARPRPQRLRVVM